MASHQRVDQGDILTTTWDRFINRFIPTGFRITTLQKADGGWIARIRNCE
jgi:hypothetical protein